MFRSTLPAFALLALAAPGVALGAPLKARPKAATPAVRAEQLQPVTKAQVTADADNGFAALDLNKDGKVDKAEVLAGMKTDQQNKIAQFNQVRDAAFARIDSNGDGSISKDEWARARHFSAPALGTKQVGEVLAVFDANKDGSISKAEFTAKKTGVKDETPATIDSEFARIDGNKDGKITGAEILARLKADQAGNLAKLDTQSAEVFAKVDTDKNGSLSKAEWGASQQATPKPLGDADVAAMTARFDANKDGLITKEEFEAPSVALFERVDTNHDGVASVEEQQKARAMAEAAARAAKPAGAGR